MNGMLVAGAALEEFLGDPCNPDSALSYAQALHTDETESFPQSAIDVLDAWGLPEFYIPEQALGGRFARMDEMLYMLRAIARRDIATAIAHAKTFLGSAAVWVAGSPSIQQRCAALIRAGEAVSLGLTEFDHGGDLVSNGCRLSPLGAGSWRLDGEKWLVNNATRSAAMTVYANQSQRQGAAAGTLLWVEKSRIGACHGTATPKIRTLGVRGADISGIRFTAATLSDGDIVGKPGQGLETTLRSLQLSRTLCCGLSTGAGDLAVRTLALFMRERVLYCKRLIDHGFGRARLANAFLLQLIAESVSFGACRMVHVQPRSMSVVSSIAKYLVPELIDDVYEQCEQGLGARAYLRTAPWSHFQKAKRDHRLVGLFDGSTVVNLQAIAFQLPRVMHRSVAPLAGLSDRVALGERLRQVFDVQARLPALDLSALSLLSTQPDAGLQFLLHGIDDAQRQALPQPLADCVQRMQTDILAFDAHVRHTLRSMPPDAPQQYDAARKFARLHAAASCFFVWYFNRLPGTAAWDADFLKGAWVGHAVEWLLAGEAGASLQDDLQPWLERLVQGQKALSFQPLASPHASGWDAQHLATCREHP